LLLRRIVWQGRTQGYSPPPEPSYSDDLVRLDDRRREGAADSGAPRFSRAFFLRWRSLRQRRIGREPRPMRRP
jgi:hypothetical protein